MKKISFLMQYAAAAALLGIGASQLVSQEKVVTREEFEHRKRQKEIREMFENEEHTKKHKAHKDAEKIRISKEREELEKQHKADAEIIEKSNSDREELEAWHKFEQERAGDPEENYRKEQETLEEWRKFEEQKTKDLVEYARKKSVEEQGKKAQEEILKFFAEVSSQKRQEEEQDRLAQAEVLKLFEDAAAQKRHVEADTKSREEKTILANIELLKKWEEEAKVPIEPSVETVKEISAPVPVSTEEQTPTSISEGTHVYSEEEKIAREQKTIEDSESLLKQWAKEAEKQKQYEEARSIEYMAKELELDKQMVESISQQVVKMKQLQHGTRPIHPIDSSKALVAYKAPEKYKWTKESSDRAKKERAENEKTLLYKTRLSHDEEDLPKEPTREEIMKEVYTEQRWDQLVRKEQEELKIPEITTNLLDTTTTTVPIILEENRQEKRSEELNTRLEDLVKKYEEIKRQRLISFAKNKQQGLEKEAATPLPIIVVEDAIEALEDIGTIAEVATVATVVGVGATIGVAKLTENVTSNVLDVFTSSGLFTEENKTTEKNMSFTPLLQDIMGFLNTVARDESKAYSYLIDKFGGSQAKIHAVLKAAANFPNTNIRPEVKAFYEDINTPQALVTKYTVDPSDAEYHKKVPRKWLNHIKSVDYGKVTVPNLVGAEGKPPTKLTTRPPTNAPTAELNNYDQGEATLELEAKGAKEDAQHEALLRERKEDAYRRQKEKLTLHMPTKTEEFKSEILKLDKLAKDIGFRDNVLEEHTKFVGKKITEAVLNARAEDVLDHGAEKVAKVGEAMYGHAFSIPIETTHEKEFAVNSLNNTLYGTPQPAVEKIRSVLNADEKRQIDYEAKNISDREGISLNDALTRVGKTTKIEMITEGFGGLVEAATTNVKEVSIENVANDYEPRENSKFLHKIATTAPKPDGSLEPGHNQFLPTPTNAPVEFDTTPVNFGNAAYVPYDVLALNVGTNVMQDYLARATVAGLLSANAIGPSGGLMMASLYNNYLKDLTSQNQIAPAVARGISNKISSLGVGAYNAWERHNQGVVESAKASENDFLMGNSNPMPKRARHDDSGLAGSRNVKSRNAPNDMSDVAAKISPINSLGNDRLVSADVEQAFLPRANTDLVRQAQHAYAAWLRETMTPYPTR